MHLSVPWREVWYFIVMIITKVSQAEFDNGQTVLSTKDFLKHDLVHFAVDKVLFIFDDRSTTSHTMEIEQIAGILHSVYDQTITNEEILSSANNMFSAYGQEVPPYFTYEFINRVRGMAHDLLDRYQNLKTRESMELI